MGLNFRSCRCVTDRDNEDFSPTRRGTPRSVRAPFKSGRQKFAVEQKLQNLAGVAAVRRELQIGDARQGRHRAGTEERLMALGSKSRERDPSSSRCSQVECVLRFRDEEALDSEGSPVAARAGSIAVDCGQVLAVRMQHPTLGGVLEMVRKGSPLLVGVVPHLPGNITSTRS